MTPPMNDDIKRLVEALENLAARWDIAAVAERRLCNGERNAGAIAAYCSSSAALRSCATSLRQALASLTTKETEHG